MEEELSNHLTYIISEKQNKLLKYISSWGNPFLMVAPSWLPAKAIPAPMAIVISMYKPDLRLCFIILRV